MAFTPPRPARSMIIVLGQPLMITVSRDHPVNSAAPHSLRRTRAQNQTPGLRCGKSPRH